MGHMNSMLYITNVETPRVTSFKKIDVGRERMQKCWVHSKFDITELIAKSSDTSYTK
jgi:hypothetical protein